MSCASPQLLRADGEDHLCRSLRPAGCAAVRASCSLPLFRPAAWKYQRSEARLLHLQGASDLQHAVRQYVNNSAICVEGHAVTGASRAAQQTVDDGTASLESASSGAVPVLVRPEVTISAVELRPVSWWPAQLHSTPMNCLNHATGHLP